MTRKQRILLRDIKHLNERFVRAVASPPENRVKPVLIVDGDLPPETSHQPHKGCEQG
jgi:hypothetical protein